MSWALRSQILVESGAAGPTTFNQAVAGSLSFAGALILAPSILISASLSFAGLLLRQTNFNLSGILSFSGVLATSKLFMKALAGFLSFLWVQASDNFNRADSSNIGSNWSEESGDWQIASNRLIQNTLSLVYNALWVGASVNNSDHFVSADVLNTFNPGNVVKVGVGARMTSGSTNSGYWLAMLSDID